LQIKIATLAKDVEGSIFNDIVCCPRQRCTDKTAFLNEVGLEQIYSFYKIPQAISKSWPSHDTTRPAEEAALRMREKTGTGLQVWLQISGWR
jgi:hypothetical protein